MTSTSRCKLCGDTKVITDNYVLLSISIDNVQKKSYNLNDLLIMKFSHWYESYPNESCEHCKSNILFKEELILTKEILVIQLISFSLQNDKLIKIPQTVNVYAIPTNKILVSGQLYKVIFQKDIENSHYISMCRQGMSTIWMEIDDAQVTKNNGLKVLKIFTYCFYKKF